MPVYFIRSEQITNNKIEMEAELAHHLRNVLRLQVGETLALVDEHPRRYFTRVISSQPGPLILEVERWESRPPTHDAKIHLGMALLKGGKMDWVVQKATEIGVARLCPLATESAVTQAQPERIARQVRRWKKIALEAAQQSCRWEMPKIDAPMSLATFLAETAAHPLKLIFSPEGAAETIKHAMRACAPDRSPRVGVLIGPEGGFTPLETASALKAGFQSASLGKTILRAETAALSALAIIQYEMRDGLEKSRTDA